MDTDVASAIAFPSSLLDEPPSGYFHSLLIRISGNLRKCQSKLLKLPVVDCRVFEKRACIADDLGIGEFGLPNFDDRLADRLDGQRFDSFLFQNVLDCSIIYMELRSLIQLECHGGDDVL